jgi:hypothetical protein
MTRVDPLGLVDTQTLENLLSARPRFNEEECEHAPLIASAVQGIADEDDMVAADAHLAACAECRLAVLTLHGIDLNMKPSSETGADSIREILPNARLKPFAWAAAAAVLLFAVIFAVHQTGTHAPLPGEGLTVKGENDALFVAVKRGADGFSARPFEQLVTGDQIGLFYTSQQAGFLAVFNVDETGTVTRLFPAAKTKSASIEKAERSPLPDGATVREGSGCEWVVAVFSDVPLELEETARFLDGTDKTGQLEACNYSAQVPGARSVVVLPLRR